MIIDDRTWICDWHDGEPEHNTEMRPADVYIEWHELLPGLKNPDRLKLAATYCHECASMLRENVDPHDQEGSYRSGRIVVTLFRSVEMQKRLAAEARAKFTDG